MFHIQIVFSNNKTTIHIIYIYTHHYIRVDPCCKLYPLIPLAIPPSLTVSRPGACRSPRVDAFIVLMTSPRFLGESLVNGMPWLSWGLNVSYGCCGWYGCCRCICFVCVCGCGPQPVPHSKRIFGVIYPVVVLVLVLVLVVVVLVLVLVVVVVAAVPVLVLVLVVVIVVNVVVVAVVFMMVLMVCLPFFWQLLTGIIYINTGIIITTEDKKQHRILNHKASPSHVRHFRQRCEEKNIYSDGPFSVISQF